jgi:tetratricopeptide (TPR) repeat protein
LGVLYQAVGRLNDAPEPFRRAVELEERLTAEYPRIVQYRSRLADGCNGLGDVLSLTGGSTEAETLLRRAIDLNKGLATDHPDVPEVASSLAQSYNNLGAHFYNNRRWAEAETEFERSLKVKQRLASDHPDQIEYAADLGSAYGNLASVEVEAGNSPRALQWWARAITTLEPVLVREPMHANTRLYLRNAHWDRSAVYKALGRPADALSDLDRTVALDDGRQRDEIRLYRTAVLAGTGKYQEALREAETLARSSSLEAGRLDYGLACTFAVASTSARQDATLEPGARAARAEQLAVRAVERLSRARDAGFFRNGTAVTDPNQDHDLDPLRSRADFQRMAMEPIIPSDPFDR